MTITWHVDSEVGSGLKQKRAIVALRKEDETIAFRRAEIAMPIDADAKQWIEQNWKPDDLWREGQPASEQGYLASVQRRSRAYYYGILQTLSTTRIAGGDLDTVIAAALQAISVHPARQAEFNSWRTLLELDTDKIKTLEAKRDLFFAILLFAEAGVLAGGTGVLAGGMD